MAHPSLITHLLPWTQMCVHMCPRRGITLPACPHHPCALWPVAGVEGYIRCCPKESGPVLGVGWRHVTRCMAQQEGSVCWHWDPASAEGRGHRGPRPGSPSYLHTLLILTSSRAREVGDMHSRGQRDFPIHIPRGTAPLSQETSASEGRARAVTYTLPSTVSLTFSKNYSWAPWKHCKAPFCKR